MIKGVFCFLRENDNRPTMYAVCSLCHIKQYFHTYCIEESEKNQQYIVCIRCHKFIQLCCDDLDTLFELVYLY